MARAVVAAVAQVVAVVAELLAEPLAGREVAVVRLVLVVQVPLPQQPQVAVVRLLVVQVRLPEEQPEVAALLVWAQGLVAFRSLRSRSPFSAATARNFRSPGQPTYKRAPSSK